MDDVLDDLRRANADAMAGQDAGRQLLYTRAISENERLRAIEQAAKYVTEKFENDEAQGYHTKDRQFAITILRKALDGNHEQYVHET